MRELDINTVLVTIRTCLNHQVDGFEQTLNDLVGENKEKFLQDCQEIVQNGWTEKFNGNENLDFLNRLLADPSVPLRLDRSFNKAASYVIRLCLFRLIVDACKENSQLIRDPKWFRETHTKLAEELNTFNNTERIVLTFNGQRIESLYDVARLRENLAQQFEDAEAPSYSILLKLMVVISMGSALLRGRVSTDTQIKVSIAISTTMALLFLLYRVVPGTRMAQTYFFANRAERQLQNQVPSPAAVLQDANVKKFVLVTEADLESLEKRAKKPGPK